jgi:hypothetical protein
MIGHLGAERAREVPDPNLLDTCWQKQSISRSSCDSDQILGAKPVLVVAGKLHFSMTVAAVEAGESQSMFLAQLDWGLWRGTLPFIGAARPGKCWQGARRRWSRLESD